MSNYRFHTNCVQGGVGSLAKLNTKAIFGKTIANSSMIVLDFAKFAQAAKTLDIPFIVDNTLAPPHLCQPFVHGANLIIHSSTCAV